jgi:GT2 family glycosyltransferase
MAKNIFINRTIQSDPFHMAEVEIIIPFHGEQQRVVKLIESIFNTVLTNRYLITLVDDFTPVRSTASLLDRVKRVPGIRSFRLPEEPENPEDEKQKHPKGFGAAVNYALKHPWVFKNNPKKKINYVCIMHSDVFPEENTWLAELGTTLEKLKFDGVKMISPTTNNPMSDLDILVGEKSQQKDDVILTDGYLPMYCALCNRELFQRVGFFKEVPYAGVEVQDFAKRMKEKGFKQAVCGKSWVHHDGGATIGKYAEVPRVQKILRNAMDEFLKRRDHTST